MVDNIIGYVKIKQKEENVGYLAYEFTDIITKELEKEENKDLKELVIKNINDLHNVILKLIDRIE